MQYFLGIRPPDALLGLVMQFRQAHGWRSSEPHITVKAPCGLGGQPTWLPIIRQLCQRIEAFPVEVGGIGIFGDAVLFLQVTSPALLTLHHRLLLELHTSFADQEACFEGLRYLPHLTLTDKQPADKVLDSNTILMAKAFFSKKTVFQANELAIYGKAEASTYQVIETLSFSVNLPVTPV